MLGKLCFRCSGMNAYDRDVMGEYVVEIGRNSQALKSNPLFHIPPPRLQICLGTVEDVPHMDAL